MNDKAVCRTALATLGLLNIIVSISLYSSGLEIPKFMYLMQTEVRTKLNHAFFSTSF